jgi:hypothetical protein
LVASAQDNLSAYAEDFHYAWSIIQGKRAHYLINLKQDILTLNISASFSRKSIGRIYAKYTDIEEIFVAICNYFSTLDSQKKDNFRRFLDIYFEAKSNGSEIKDRVIFTFLLYEFIRGESEDEATADQNVSSALGITKREAAIIRFTRNRYIHYGSNLGQSVLWAHAKASQQYTQDKDRFYVDPNNSEQTGLMFYMQVIMFFEEYLKDKFKFSSDLNDYKYEIQKRTT